MSYAEGYWICTINHLNYSNETTLEKETCFFILKIKSDPVVPFRYNRGGAVEMGFVLAGGCCFSSSL